MNKRYIYTFLVALGVSLVVFLGSLWTIGFFRAPQDLQIQVTDIYTVPTTADNSTVVDNPEYMVNVVVFGLNDGLADTIIFVNYNLKSNKLNMLTIPRDTYFPVPGYDDPWQRKINSVYSYKEDGGVLGMKKQISRLLGVDVDYYVKIDFASVVTIVDTLGGYEVYLPYAMQYDDPYDNPPLHIDLPAGWNNLDGLNTLKYLRFRKSNDGSISEGDIDRMARQKAFMEAMIQKALNPELVNLLTTLIKGNVVGTDVTLDKMFDYASTAVALKPEDVKIYSLEGEVSFFDETSYFLHDKDKLAAMIRMFYNMGEESTTESTTGSENESTNTSEVGTSTEQSGDGGSGDSE